MSDQKPVTVTVRDSSKSLAKLYVIREQLEGLKMFQDKGLVGMYYLDQERLKRVNKLIEKKEKDDGNA